MRFNFKKISAVAISSLLTGMSMGVAAAASYPAPFVTGGVANTAIVYGTGQGVDVLDQTYAASIQTDLQKYVSTSSDDTTTTIEGDVVSLDTSNTRIWLNTSLNTAKTTLSKTDLPTVLADYTFSGNVDSKLTSTIKINSGTAAGSDNSNKVIYAKQPKSSSDPVVGISMGSSQTAPLYNATATMAAVEFNSSDSEGETIQLFGKEFVVSTATDGTNLVLFSSAEEVTLTVGGSSPSPSATVNVAGTDYVITLVSGSDTTATIDVDGSSKEITEGTSKKVGGIDVAIKSVDESEAINTITATVLVGSQKLTFTNGAAVTKGSDDTPIDGTYAYLKGGPSALTELTVAVYRPDSSNDAILAGTPFTDPVFESFKIDFQGLSSPLDDTDREKISVLPSGDDTMSLIMTDSEDNTKTIDFAHNESNMWRLADDGNHTIHVKEGANVTENQYVVLGNEDYGHLLQVTRIYNTSSGSNAITGDKVTLEDQFSGETFDAVFTSTEGVGTVTIDGKSYTVTFFNSGDGSNVTFKYPTGDSAAGHYVIYPTIKTQNGALVALYEPMASSWTQLDLADMDGAGTDALGLMFPDGDGYKDISVAYSAGTEGLANWTIDGTTIAVGPTAANISIGHNVTVTVGQLKYNISASNTTVNKTDVYLIDPEGTAHIDNPAVVIFEGKNDNNAYDAVVVDLEGNAQYMGSSTNGVGVNDVLFSTAYGHYSAALASDSDITKDLDWFGTLTTMDAGDSDQKKLDIAYDAEQVYAKIYVGEESAVISNGGSSSGAVLVTDAEVASVSSKELVIVGGSCINSAAAKVLGFTGAACGAAFTAKTGVGSGQFLIKGVKDVYSSGKLALVVAGYDVQDTANAVQYLTKQKPDTSKSYKGTSATAAQELVVTSA